MLPCVMNYRPNSIALIAFTFTFGDYLQQTPLLG
jgi:hypothetical protein